MAEFMKDEKSVKYVNNLGLECPKCGSDDIQSLEHEMYTEPNTRWIPVHCHTCKCRWDEVWRLAGIETNPMD